MTRDTVDHARISPTPPEAPHARRSRVVDRLHRQAARSAVEAMAHEGQTEAGRLAPGVPAVARPRTRDRRARARARPLCWHRVEQREAARDEHGDDQPDVRPRVSPRHCSGQPPGSAWGLGRSRTCSAGRRTPRARGAAVEPYDVVPDRGRPPGLTGEPSTGTPPPRAGSTARTAPATISPRCCSSSSTTPATCDASRPCPLPGSGSRSSRRSDVGSSNADRSFPDRQGRCPVPAASGTGRGSGYLQPCPRRHDCDEQQRIRTPSTFGRSTGCSS